jgi:hypothetical protein
MIPDESHRHMFRLSSPPSAVTGRCSAVLLALVAQVAPSVVARAQDTQWPGGRSAHGMVWHGRLNQALVLGGFGPSRDSALWGWDGTRWRTHGVGGPGSRSHFAVAYDAHRDRVVVHGGGAGGIAGPGGRPPRRMADTWEWDGRRWQVVSAEGPPARDHHAGVYDPIRRQTVIFGGADSAGNQLSDTWGWDGRSWQLLAPDGPPGRSTHRLVFDSHRGVVVMFGGWGANGLLNDTWEWDGVAWKKVETAAAPAIRFASRMAYDTARHRVVLFGGRSGNSNLADTWEYDGRTWTRQDVAGPAMRNVHEMVYDPRARTTLLFSGFNAPVVFDDLWRYDGRWKQLPRPDANLGRADHAMRGPYLVGYRVIDHWDRTRRRVPLRDFEGRPTAGEGAVPMQLSVWYPAVAGDRPMRIGEYWAVGTKTETLGPFTEGEVTAASERIRGGMLFAIGTEVPRVTADSIRDARAAAFRDAAPAIGRFPLVVTGVGPVGIFGLAEYLASHGYVVVAAPAVGTGSQQVNRVQIAIETHTRNMETAAAIAATLPFVDATRQALIGVNFDGLAALVHQMRNGGALAVVSLDGYEAKTVTATGLRQSPYFDPARMRVPYLSFAQDNPPTPALAFSDSLARELKYSERHAYVVRDMEHVHLLGNLTVYPQLRAEQRLGYDFVWRTTRSFLDAHVKQDSVSSAFLARSATANGYPAWLVKREVKLPALPAIPTSEEVERIAMTGDVERLRTIFRRARAADPSVRMFTTAELNLFAFRFSRQGNRTAAIGLLELADEAFPTSVAAANNLGNGYRDAGDVAKAVEVWERALRLVDSDAEIASADKASVRNTIEQKLRQVRQ